MDSVNFHFDEIKKTLHTWVCEMYSMRKGAFVIDPDRVVQSIDVRFIRRAIKHIVEQRKAGGKSIPAIKEMLDSILSAMADFDFEIANPNVKYQKSVLRVKILNERRGIVVVLDRKIQNYREIITAHPCSAVYAIRFLKKKKLHTTAAGETPGPWGQSSHRSSRLRMMSAVKGDFLTFSSRCVQFSNSL